ncbi:zinc ribbon domain-containing protein [bacterium]|nr:zinc ribbon domain-containing protein [bacterium]
MPLYTYQCKDCGNTFEQLTGVVSDKKGGKCPQCLSQNIKRIMSSFNVGSNSGNSNPSCPSGICGLG